MRLEGKVGIVVGAGQTPGETIGNGRATAVLFAREGARVVLVDRDEAALTETADMIAGEGGTAIGTMAEATDEAAMRLVAERALDAFGRIDILHHNVGGSIPGGPEEMSVEEFRAQIDLNLTSAFIAAKAVLPAMVRQGSGVITTVGSIGGLAHLGHHHVGYSASKAGLVQFTRQIAAQYGPRGIRCNTIIPGMMDTPLLAVRVSKQKGRKNLEELREEAKTRVPLGRRGDAWDIAHAALFLASDEAKYITGTELLVDGGLMARSG